jgi:hypothetical protein
MVSRYIFAVVAGALSRTEIEIAAAKEEECCATLGALHRGVGAGAVGPAQHAGPVGLAVHGYVRRLDHAPARRVLVPSGSCACLVGRAIDPRVGSHASLPRSTIYPGIRGVGLKRSCFLTLCTNRVKP